MMDVVAITGDISRANLLSSELQSNCHHQQTNTQLFTGRMPFLSPNQQCQSQWCGLRPSVLGQDRSETKKIGLGIGHGLAGLLCCDTQSYACRYNDLEGHSNFSSTIFSFSILCLEHHYCGDQQWRSLA